MCVLASIVRYWKFVYNVWMKRNFFALTDLSQEVRLAFSKFGSTAILCSCAFLLAGCGGSGDGAESSESGSAAATSDASQSGAAEEPDTVAAAADEAGDTVEEAVDATSDKVANVTENAADRAQDAAEDAKQAATSAAEDGEAAVRNAVADASDQASAVAASAQGEGGSAGSEYDSLTGDAAQGRRVFAKCMACHSVQEGQNRVGPSLYGIIGREAGSVEGFNYSEANANSGITWTEEVMFEYLEAPQEYIPGTRMIFPGLPKAQDRADVIAYLKSASE